SATNGLTSTPGAGEGDDAVTRFRDDREDPGCLRDTGRLERRRGVLPAERPAGKALEPGLPLRPRGRRLQLEVQVRAARMAGHADQADLRPGGERDTVGHRTGELGEGGDGSDLPVLGSARPSAPTP